MTDTNKPRFTMTLQLCKEPDSVQVAEPAFINDKLIKAASNMIGLFVEQELDGQNMQVPEDKFREFVVEIAYRVILHEMTHVRQLKKKGNP